MYSTTLRPVHVPETHFAEGNAATVSRKHRAEKAHIEPRIHGGVTLKSTVPLLLRTIAPFSAVVFGTLGMSLLAGNPLVGTVLMATAPVASELVNSLADYIETENFSHLETALFKAGKAVLSGTQGVADKYKLVSGIVGSSPGVSGILSTESSSSLNHKTSEATPRRKEKAIRHKKTRVPVAHRRTTKARKVSSKRQPEWPGLNRRGIAPEDIKKVESWLTGQIESAVKDTGIKLMAKGLIPEKMAQ